MGVITGITYTPIFLLPSMSILPMDLNRGQTGLFCSLHLKDLSTKGTIFQLYDENLYCTAIYGSTYFFHYMNSKHFQWSLHQSAVQNFHGRVVFHYLDSVASSSDFILQVLRPPWVQL